MLRYAARALPVTRLVVVSVVVVVLMTVVGRWPWTMWPLEGCAVGLVAAGAAWCCDEPAAAVADPTPRPLAWRTAARLTGVGAVLAVWATTVLAVRDSLFGHAGDVALQGGAASLAAVAWATWRRSLGAPSPGDTVALTVVPILTFWALVRPVALSVPVFPYSPDASVGGDWAVSRMLWSGLAAGSAALLVAALLDARWWPHRVRTSRGRAQSTDAKKDRIAAVSPDGSS